MSRTKRKTKEGVTWSGDKVKLVSNEEEFELENDWSKYYDDDDDEIYKTEVTT